MSNRFTSRSLASGLCAAIAIAGCRDATAPASSSESFVPVYSAAPAPSINSAADLIPDQYIVVFRDGETDVDGKAKRLVAKTTGKLQKTYAKGLKGFAAGMTAAEAAAMAADPSVAYVEQDRLVSIQQKGGGGGGKKGGARTTSAVTQRKAPWGLDRIDQAALPLEGTYLYAETGAGVNVYIIDTGIRPTHSEFEGRVTAGYNAIGDSLGTYDCHWHGTHVAGIVGGKTSGVAKGVTLHPVRTLGCSGSGSVSNVIAGIDWVVANAQRPAVINMSLAAWYSDALNAAVERAFANGIVVVSASGNGADDACKYSPMSAPNAITVGATNSLDAQAVYSNWGSCVDILAPGDAITSASNEADDSMKIASGTSMAAPHVAGAAALFLEVNPGASPDVVAQSIIGRSTSGVLSNILAGTENRLLRTR